MLCSILYVHLGRFSCFVCFGIFGAQTLYHTHTNNTSLSNNCREICFLSLLFAQATICWLLSVIPDFDSSLRRNVHVFVCIVHNHSVVWPNVCVHQTMCGCMFTFDVSMQWRKRKRRRKKHTLYTQFKTINIVCIVCGNFNGMRFICGFCGEFTKNKKKMKRKTSYEPRNLLPFLWS